jgi:hypothetical protein
MRDMNGEGKRGQRQGALSNDAELLIAAQRSLVAR